MTTQTKLRTNEIIPNTNICFPIGTILAVKNQYEKLGFSRIFGKHKQKGRDINSLLMALISYKLTDNFSIRKASDWINRNEVLDTFDLDQFEERTLYRLLETIGQNKEEIIADIQDSLFENFDFEHTNINMDWTSVVIFGNQSPLGKHGYSRDHRPDKKQITIGISELAEPINIPIGITVKEGNVPDVTHFTDTYQQINTKLKKGSRIVFDKGANSKGNIKLILKDKMKYLTSKKLNASDDKRIETFDKSKAELIDSKKGIYGIKFVKPNSIDYFYFSEAREVQQLEASAKRAMRKLEEAKEIQRSIDNNRQLPKKYRINNVLIDVVYSYQTKLQELTEDAAFRIVEEMAITGREGFFCFKSNEDLTLRQALETYRKKDSIEKIMHSLKNEIEIKPLRVWSDDSIYGAIIVGFIAQVFISLMRYEIEELKNMSTKFIKKSLMNLTVTVDFLKSGAKKLIYANFDAINTRILRQDLAIP